MNVFSSVILAVQMLAALGMIGLVLVQHGKGADMGASFGSGASGSLFGASGSANFLSRSTALWPRCSSWRHWPGLSGQCPVSSGSVLEALRCRLLRLLPRAASNCRWCRRASCSCSGCSQIPTK
jgi:preprotein translocase subunit SecG